MIISVGKDCDIVLKVASQIGPLSKTVQQLIALFGSDDWEVDDLTRIVRLDQVLTMRLLKEANSVTKRGRRAVDNVEEAILRIGPPSVLTYAIINSPKHEILKAEIKDRMRSVAAALSVELARTAGIRIDSMPVVAQSAALLHDFGRLVLRWVANGDKMDDRSLVEKTDQLGLLDRERSEFGIDHAELGAWIAERWLLPRVLVCGIANHHDPDETPHLVTDLAHMASEVAESVVEGDSEELFDRIAPGVVDRLDLSPAVIFRLFSAVNDQLEEALLSTAP